MGAQEQTPAPLPRPWEGAWLPAAFQAPPDLGAQPPAEGAGRGEPLSGAKPGLDSRPAGPAPAGPLFCLSAPQLSGDSVPHPWRGD